MDQRILIFKLLILFYLFFNSASFAQTIIQGKAKIIDGDTIHIGKNKIRLHGIDAPEIEQTCNIKEKIWNCGLESSTELKELIAKKEVRCVVSDIDRYKRYVAKCYVNNLNINQYMVRQGWAIAYRHYSTLFIEDEVMAKKNKLGIWQGVFIEPYLFRKNSKN